MWIELDCKKYEGPWETMYLQMDHFIRLTDSLEREDPDYHDEETPFERECFLYVANGQESDMLTVKGSYAEIKVKIDKLVFGRSQ